MKILNRFKEGEVKTIVATDVAARGVDVKDVTLVINMDLPNEAEAYVHRIGRTGRAGATGHAISYCSPEEHEFFMDIEKLIQQKIPVNINHTYHHEELAKLHSRGLKSPESTRDNGSKTRKGGGGGGRGRQGGQNRKPQGQGQRRSSAPSGGNRRRHR